MVIDEISTLVNSPTFWFATVFVSLIVSMLGNLIYSGFQKIWANFSKNQAEKNASQLLEYNNLVTNISNSETRVSDMEIHSIYSNLWNILFLLVLLICAIFLNYISEGTAILKFLSIILWLGILLVANQSIKSASYDRKLINAVRKHRSETKQDSADKE